MNRITLSFLAAATLMIVGGFYLIYPPLALISGGLVMTGFGVLFWEVEDEE